MTTLRMTRCPCCGSPTTLSSAAPEPIERTAIRVLAADLDGAPEDCWRFFAALWTNERPRTARMLARDLGVCVNTLGSRFFREHLPPPRVYLVYARLARTASLFERTDEPLARAVYGLDWSTPNAFHRTVRQLLGCTALEFRRQYTGAAMLDVFRSRLVAPHLATLRTFSPLNARGKGASRQRLDGAA